jgi:hypothetical protein
VGKNANMIQNMIMEERNMEEQKRNSDAEKMETYW